MSYTREQRAANAAKAAEKAASMAEATGETPQPEAQPERDTDTTTRVQLRNDRRTSAEAELEERHAKRSGIEEPKEEAPEAPAPTAAAPVEPPAAPATPEPAPAAAPVPAVEMVTVKVDGESFEVAKSEVEDAGGVRAYQTIRAADNRLRKANETLARTNAAQEQAAALARAMMARQTPPVPEPTDDDLIQAIRFGTPQEASAALAKVAAKGRGPQVDHNQVVFQAAAINNYNAARRRFASEFADLVKDPILTDAMLAQENKWVQSFAQNGQVNWANLSNVDFEDGFRRIGNQVRSAFGRQPQSAPAPAVAGTAAPTASTPSSPSAKEERKASIVNLPTAAQRATPPEEEKPPTREQILNEELKARGRPPMF